MAEKVRNGIDGLHVEPGNPHAWASTLAYVAQHATLWGELAANITPRVSLSQAAGLYIDLITPEAPVREIRTPERAKVLANASAA
jgi:hypothetical protein